MGTSGWSERWNFVVSNLPGQPILVAPEDGAVITTDSVSFFWNRSVPDVDRYWLEYSGDSSFATSTIDSTIEDTTLIVSGLQSNVYWWRTRAHNVTGWGPFSEVWSFSVLISGVRDEQDVPTEFFLSQNYPNPFNPTTVIRYGLPERSQVKLELFNLLGQSVAVLVNIEQEAGYHSALLESRGLASGLYFYRLKAGDFVETRKLIILR
jgi:hypothetical protein